MLHKFSTSVVMCIMRVVIGQKGTKSPTSTILIYIMCNWYSKGFHVWAFQYSGVCAATYSCKMFYHYSLLAQFQRSKFHNKHPNRQIHILTDGEI